MSPHLVRTDKQLNLCKIQGSDLVGVKLQVMSLPLNDHQVLQLDQLPELVHHLWEEKMEVVGMHLDWEDLCPFRRSKRPKRHGQTLGPVSSDDTFLRHSKY